MIHVENLTKHYGDVCAVDHINIDIKKGEILGLLGPNGAGKTTTLRMLTGFLTPSTGTIQVKDYDIAHQSIEIKKIMGYLPESAPLYHDMLTYDYLNYIADIRELPSERKQVRIRELGDLCGLDTVMHKPIGELSKGFRQRVGLAHAMLSDPEILILDEPTSGLDPNQIVEIRDIIKRIGKQKTIILSTHILSEAEATCDRIVIISQGKIVADGDIENLKRSAGNTTLIHLIFQQTDTETVRRKLSATAGVDQIVRVADDNGSLKVTLSVSSSRDTRGAIYRTIKETDWVLLEFYQESQTLETVFRELTKEN